MTESKIERDTRAAMNFDHTPPRAYAALIVALVLFLWGGASYLLLRGAERDLDRLAHTTAQVIGAAADRVGLAGNYHLRLLVEGLALRNPDIAYVAIVDREGLVIAHSDPGMNATLLDDPASLAALGVLDGSREAPWRRRVAEGRIDEVVLPFTYGQRILGVVRVGISREASMGAARTGILFIGAMALVLAGVFLVIARRLGTRLSASVAGMPRTLGGIFRHAPFGIFVLGRSGQVLRANRVLSEVLDLPAGAAEGRFLDALAHQTGENALLVMANQVFRAAKARHQEIDLIVDRGVRPVAVTMFPVANDGSGRTSEICGFVTDLSEAKLREEQLRRSQRMDALGQFAAGIAHVFNNLFTGILGNAELALADAPRSSEQQARLGDLLHDANMAAGLTGRLIDFGRQQHTEPVPVDLGAAVQDVASLLERIIGERIRLETRLLEARPVTVLADRVHIEQVILTLANNAREAMPEGGKLDITVSRAEAGPRDAAAEEPDAPHGWGVLTVSDTGVGMDGRERKQAFEPFYTTKDPGLATGLGLSMVREIVHHHGGEIEVESRRGEGATFRVVLPIAVVDETRPAGEPPHPKEVLKGEGERILIVEDDANVREFLTVALRRSGYATVEVADGAAALALYGRESERIDMVLLDVVLPGMVGPKVLDAMREIDPGVRAAFISGYTDDQLKSRKRIDEAVDYQSKPVSRDELLRLVRGVLDRR